MFPVGREAITQIDYCAMKSTLLLLAVILSLAIFTAAQTHTFCSSDQACTVSALWNYTGGLQSGGANVATLPVNLAGGSGVVTGVLPGANMAATNLAGGNNPGGVAGTLPGSSMAVFVASGASHAPGAVPDPGAAAGTTHFLREDATWQTVPPSGVSESFISFAGGGAGTGGIAEETFQKTVITNAHTLTRFTVAVLVQGVTCATTPVVALWDATAGSALNSQTIANSTAFFDSGAISVAVTAGHQIDIKVTTANSGCGTQPTLGNMVATFQ
jgi:hypothetical protein